MEGLLGFVPILEWVDVIVNGCQHHSPVGKVNSRGYGAPNNSGDYIMVTPQSLIKKSHRPAKYTGCIPTFTGLSFNVLDPKPEQVKIADIARGLAYKYRFGGLVGSVTVAEHSVMVANIIQTMWPNSGAALAGLLHDSCEAYTQDIQATVRDSLLVVMPNGETISWAGLERKLNQAVSRALSDGTDFYSRPEVQAADIIALAIEKADSDQIRDEKWGLPPVPAEVSHLSVQSLTPEAAMVVFMAKYDEIYGDREAI